MNIFSISTVVIDNVFSSIISPDFSFENFLHSFSISLDNVANTFPNSDIIC